MPEIIQGVEFKDGIKQSSKCRLIKPPPTFGHNSLANVSCLPRESGKALYFLVFFWFREGNLDYSEITKLNLCIRSKVFISFRVTVANDPESKFVDVQYATLQLPQTGH